MTCSAINCFKPKSTYQVNGGCPQHELQWAMMQADSDWSHSVKRSVHIDRVVDEIRQTSTDAHEMYECQERVTPPSTESDPVQMLGSAIAMCVLIVISLILIYR